MSDAEFVDTSGRLRKRKTHCKYGHEFSSDARWSVNWRGYRCRVCKECEKLRARRKRENPERKRLDRERTARWRAQDPLRARETWQRAQQKRNEWLRSFKTQCKFCGESRYPCLDFHHRDSKQKVATIGQVRSWSKDRLFTEIQKCDVICANCHRWHHWEEQQKRNSEGV